MQFVPTDDYIYPWPVKVVLPSLTEAGKTVTETFTAMFKLLPTDQAESLNEQRRKAIGEDETAANFVQGQKAFIHAVMVGWDENTVLDAKKKPISFSTAALDQFLNIAPIRAAIIRDYGASLAERPTEGN